MSKPSQLVGIALCLMVASCSMQRVDESIDRAEASASEASEYAEILRNRQAAQKRETVVFSQKPYVSIKPLTAKHGIPSNLDCDVAYRPAESVSINEIAQYISKECHLPVIVSPDALNPGVLSAPGGSGSAPSPDSLAGLMPAGVISTPGSSMSLSSAYSSGGQISNLKYSGKASGLLEEVTARLGLAYRFSKSERAIYISYLETKVFDIYTFGDEQVIESTVKSGMVTSAGNSGGSAGSSSSGSSSSGVSGESGSNQSTTVKLKSSILLDIQNNVKAMLSASPVGRMSLSPSTGTMTVTDRPDVISKVEDYINKMNHSITRQVLFNVKVFEVSLTDSDQLGLNWSAVYQSLNNKWGFSLSNTMPGISTSAISGSVGIVESANSAWAGSTAIIQALAEQGRVSNVRSPSVTTLNLQPAPIQIGNVKGYIESSSTTTTASVGATTAMNPGTITSGFNMTLLPKLMDEDSMLVMISINMNSKPTFDTFTQNGSTVQVPDYDAKGLSPKVKLRSGQTLILSGFDEVNEDASKVGTGSPWWMWFGGGRSRTSTHSVLVVLITPILMN
ncbi:PilN family type IVB pilus formation outer membrane protein [Pseudomonas cichorii]|uniref:PilN family type IVB pilus formation outer membrane protein n=1 Tax=Pseudomonas cichorii TaxID=36746 RepID=UPI0018E619CC|nr:PilN family type IVB pilus formation outer membrane protein [Pseudomonas cichorii]MBI6855929.1 PilN family type IVB pilus formation outer membrane protein [Pseudomonas cichorii]